MATTDSATASPRPSRRMHRLAVMGGPTTRPISGKRWFPLYGLLHHVGRKTGRAYATPVVIRRAGDSTYVPLPFGERTDWYRNALVAGGVRATWKGRDVWLARPTIVDGQQARAGFSPVMRAMMRAAGIREFVRFDPVDDHPER